jgi:hypothetical protein
MAAFETVRPRRPAGLLVIPVTAFADDWFHRPTAPVAVGIRLLSEQDGQIATANAARSTVEFFGGGDPAVPRPSREVENEIYVSRIMGFAIARAVCDPNDVMKGHEALPALEDHVFSYLTPDGIRFVFEAMQQTTAKASPLSPAASDAELRVLFAHLSGGTIAKLDVAEQLAVRRLLGCALEALRVAAPNLGPEEGESDDEDDVDGESVYDLRVHA